MAKSIIGLDIGTNNVKAVELAGSGKDFSIVHVGFANIEAIPDLTNEEDRYKATVKAINSVLPPGALKNKKVITSLSGQSVLVRTIALPKGPVQKLPREELKRMIITEVEAEIPFPVEEAELDFFIQGEVTETKEEKLKIVVAVVPRGVVQKHLDLIKEIGIEHEGIDVIPFALVRSLGLLKERLNVETVAMVEMGATSTEVVVVRGGELQFTRNIPLGGNLLTRAIEDIMNLDYTKAETLKTKEGLPSTVGPQFERIATEIRNSLSYYQLQEHHKIDLVIISGGGTKLKDAVTFLKEKIDIPIEILNPLETVKCTLKNIPLDFVQDIASYLGICIGLAIKPKKGEQRINLLPEELRKVVVPLKTLYVTCGVLTASFLIVVYLFLNFKIKKLDNQIGSKTKELTNLQEIINKTQEAQKLSDELKVMEGMVKDIFTGNPPFAQVLEEIAASLPSNIWLKELKFAGEAPELTTFSKKDKKQQGPPPTKTMNINGISLKTQGVADLMLKLETYPHFTGMELEGASQSVVEKSEVISFSFFCTLKPDQKL